MFRHVTIQILFYFSIYGIIRLFITISGVAPKTVMMELLLFIIAFVIQWIMYFCISYFSDVKWLIRQSTVNHLLKNKIDPLLIGEDSIEYFTKRAHFLAEMEYKSNGVSDLLPKK